MARKQVSDFQKRFARDFGDQHLDPVTVAVFNEIAIRLANSDVWPPGITRIIATTMAQVVNEVQNIPEALLPEAEDEQSAA